jgi:hypothetical protein
MLAIVQIWDAQKQALAGRVRATSRRIASKVAEVLHDGKTAKIVPKADATPNDVRFASKADICSATAHVRFTSNSDRESGFPQQSMSALPPKADMCGAASDVRFGP